MTSISINKTLTQPDDIADIVRIYRECFPGSIRSLLGHRACIHYFRAALEDTDAEAIIAKENDRIVGFALLHKSDQRPDMNRWLVKSIPDVLHLSLHTTVSILFKALKKAARKVANPSRDVTKSCKAGKAPEDEFMLYLDILGVTKTHRQKGIGRLLVQRCLQIATQEGFDKIELIVKTNNSKAIHLYEDVGFECLIKDDDTRYCTLCIHIEPGVVCNGKKNQ